MLTSFQRSMFVKQLRDKQAQWKLPETKNVYFKNFQTDPYSLTPPCGIERDDNGYFYLSDNLFVYCNLRNGLIVRIKKDWSEKDWTCYSELYQISQQTGEFRIDIPLYREVINVDGSDWEYAELRSPNSEYGKNSDDDVFQWPELTNGLQQNNNITEEFKDQVAQYHRDFADQAAIVLKYAIDVSDKHNAGLPGNLCRPTTRYQDNLGYFWSDFDQDNWDQDKSSSLKYFLNMFAGTLGFAKTCGVIDDSRIHSTIEYARKKWTMI